jgi:hypothetical protein
LKSFDIQKYKSDVASVHWEGNKKGNKIIGLIDHRYIYTSSEKAIINFDKQIQLAMTASKKKD